MSSPSASMSSTISLISLNHNGVSVFTSFGHEFATGNEVNKKSQFFRIVNAINEGALYRFASIEGGITVMNMKNVIYVHYKLDNPMPFEGTGVAAIPVQFHFTNHPPVTIKCTVDSVLLKVPHTSEKVEKLSAQTVARVQQLGKVDYFTSGNETLIFQRKFLTRIIV